MADSSVKLSNLRVLVLLVPPLLYGCTTSDAAGDGKGLADLANTPGVTAECVAPNIVTENGTCEAPKELSWKKA